MSVKVLYTPDSYYESLLLGISVAKTRIVLSALYLGPGPKELSLLDAIKLRLIEVPSLLVEFRLDYRRATRVGSDGKSSVSVISDILGTKCKVCLYDVLANTSEKEPLDSSQPVKINNCKASITRMSVSDRILRAVLPPRLNEVIGCYHAKYAVFDNDAIITGANLSQDYFFNRQDRYILFSGNESLCNYLHDWRPSSSLASSKYTFDQTTDEYEARFEVANPTFSSFDETDLDVDFITSAVERCSGIKFLTAYFNPPDALLDRLFRTPGCNSIDLITSSPECNGFHGSKGFSGWLPPLYEVALAQTFLRLGERRRKEMSSPSVDVSTYCRNKWTFHAKGIYGIDKAGSVTHTLFGSSNLSYRSFARDLELNVALKVKSLSLAEQFNKELRLLTGDCVKLTECAAKASINRNRLANLLFKSLKLVRSLL